MLSSIVVFAVALAALGLLLGYASSYDAPTANRILLTTDKTEYEKGEVITFTATNLSSEALIFPGSALGMQIENIDTGTVYGVIGTAALISIEPGESRQTVWQDTDEVEIGEYTATIRTAGGEVAILTAEVNFRIS